MKKLIAKLVLFGAMILASVQLSYAVSVSSQPNYPESGFVGASFLIQANESLSYIIETTTGVGSSNGISVALQYASNNQNWVTEYTTSATHTGAILKDTGTLPIKSQKTYYRFKILSSSGVVTTITLSDNDDHVMTIKNRKNVDVLILNDESLELKGRMKADKENYVIDLSSAIITLSTMSQLQFGDDLPINKRYSSAKGQTVKLKNSFNIIVSTLGVGGTSDPYNWVLGARPIITTETAKNGDTLTFQCLSSSITFTSGTNTGLILGASTRSLGLNDVLKLIYYNGFWRELFFANNLE